MKFATVIVNPTAGRRDVGAQIRQAAEELTRRGWTVNVEETLRRGDATVLARRAAASGQQAVLIVGGDGTLNEAANGLVGSETALGILPVGTGNAWARLLGLPIGKPVQAARLLADGSVRVADVGRAGNRYFLQWVGIGFDATVTREVESRQWAKRRLGPLAYILAGVRVALRYQSEEANVTADGQTSAHRMILAVAANSRHYAAILRLAPRARLDDGTLDLFVFHGNGFCQTLRHFILLLFGRHETDAAVWHERVQRVSVEAARPLDVQIDGEPADTTPVEISVIPRALRVLVPVNAPLGLFLACGTNGAV